MPGLTVHHLNCASIRSLSNLGQHLVCHVLLVETPSSGLVLVDSGLGTADYADLSSRLGAGFAKVYARPAKDPSLAAIHQIRALGHDPADVRHIVQTHLDLDHVGGLSDFPNARVHVHADELAAARALADGKARRRYRPSMWAHNPEWATYTTAGDSWFGFDAVKNLPGLPEEILTVPLLGHSHGHVGVAVNSASGWLLDAGDAYFDAREVKQPVRKCGPGVALFQALVTTDVAVRDHNQDRLRALHAEHPEIDVFAAHNPHEYLELARRKGQAVRGVYASGRRGVTER